MPAVSVRMVRPVSKRQTLQSPCGAVSKIVFPHLPQTRAFVVSARFICQLLVLQYGDKMAQLIFNLGRLGGRLGNLIPQQSSISTTETVKRLFYGVFGHPQLLRDFGLRRPIRFTDKKLFQSIE